MDSNLQAICTDNLIDDLSSISMENMSGHMISPTQLLNNRSASQTSSYVDGKMTSHSQCMDTSQNMVVNDMSSLLTQLAEENRLLNGAS